MPPRKIALQLGLWIGLGLVLGLGVIFLRAIVLEPKKLYSLKKTLIKNQLKENRETSILSQ